MEAVFFTLLFILGACFGSFLCCQARRLHFKQGSKSSRRSLGSRSVCLHCHRQLRWYDNIPIFSWLFLRGRCRQCRRKIGVAEIFSELGTASAFLALGTTIDFTTTDPLTWTAFISILSLTLSLIYLAIYDGIYGELPTGYLVLAIALAIVTLSLSHAATLITDGFTPELIYWPLLSVLILGGLYLILYLVSKGKWVGDGDWLLGVAIGIALGSPWLALITLFLANLLACLYALPRLKKTKKIYLGPFLVIAFIVVYTFSDFLQSML